MKKIILLFLLLLFIGLRIFFLNADPYGIGWSTGAWTDPGFYLHNARHKALFNEWSFGNWDNRFLFPAFTFYYYTFFIIFGVNKFAVIFATIFSQLITLFFLFKCFTLIYKNYLFSILGIFVYSYLFYFVRNGRLPFLENIMIMFFTVSLYFLIYTKKHSIIYSAWFFVLSLLSKLNIIYFFPAILIYLFKEKKINALCKFFIITVSAIIILSIIIIFYQPAIINYTITNKPFPGLSIKGLVYNLYNSTVFMRMPVISIFAYLYLSFICIYKIKLNNYTIFLIISFVATHLSMSVSSYLPERYYSIITFINFLLFIDFLKFIKTTSFNKFNFNFIKILISLFIFHLISYNFVWVYNRSILKRRILFESMLLNSLWIGLALVLLLVIIIVLIKKNHKILIIFSLCTISFIFNIYQFVLKSNNRSYSTYRIQNYIINNLNSNAVITGWWAPHLALYSNLKILTIYDGKDYFDYYYDYLILEGEEFLSEKYNKNIKQIQSFYIEQLRKKIVIYEVLNNFAVKNIFLTDNEKVLGGVTDKYGYVSPVKKNIYYKNENNIILNTLNQLLSGVTDAEKNIFSASIPKGTKILNFSIENKTAIINFSNELLNHSGGTTNSSIIANSILYTLKQFDEIEKVLVLVEGQFYEDGHILWNEPM